MKYSSSYHCNIPAIIEIVHIMLLCHSLYVVGKVLSINFVNIEKDNSQGHKP